MRVYLSIALCCVALGCSDADEPAADTETIPDTTPDTTPDSDPEATPDTEPEITPETVAETETTPETPEEALAATVAAFCPGYADAWCTAAFGDCRCDVAPGFPDAAACRVGFEARCERELASFLEPVRSGQAVFDPSAAGPCIGELEALFAACVPMPNDLFFMSCPVLSPPGGWEGVLPGAGQPCEGSCLPGLRCATDATCKVAGGLDAACSDLPDCAADLVCREGKCAPPDFSETEKSCAGPEACGGDTNCLASVRKACVAAVPGGPCRFDDECPSTEYCVFGEDPLTGACSALPGDGADCANGAMCAAGLGCDMLTTKCGPLPGSGAPCASGANGPILCGADLACSDGFCRPIPGLGEACAMGPPHCAAGLGCAFGPEGSFCREPADIGTTCENDSTCKPELYCEFALGACAADLAIGDPCVNGNECGDGVCLPDATFTFRCAPRPGLGEECFLDDCGGDLVCKSPITAGACVPEFFCRMLQF